MKRLSGFVVVMVGSCSSAALPPPEDPMRAPAEDREILSTTPRTDRPAEPDPQPVVERLPAERPTMPPPPLEACLPAGAGASLALDQGRLRACWNRSGNFAASDDACLWLAADGTAIAGDPPPATAAVAGPAFPQVAVSEDHKIAQVCVAAGSCQTLVPTLVAGRTIHAAVIDPAGQHVALLLHDGGLADGLVEVYAVRDGKKIATGKRRAPRRTEISYAIAWLGASLVWVEYSEGGDIAKPEVWKLSRNKLKKGKAIGVRGSDWGAVGKDRYVFVGDGDRAEVWDVAKMKRTAKIDLSGLIVGRAEKTAWAEAGQESMLQTADGMFSVLVMTRLAARVAFVDLAANKPRPKIVEVPICS
jgi:hypothetical protein